MAAKNPPAIIPPGIDESSPVAFKEYRPDTYEKILESLAAGGAVSVIASAAGVRRGLIHEIARLEGHTIAEKKEALAAKFRSIAAKAASVTYEGLDECSARDAAVIMGISCDKFMALEGEPAAIVEHHHKVDPTPLNTILDAARRLVVEEKPRAKIIEADFAVGQE